MKKDEKVQDVASNASNVKGNENRAETKRNSFSRRSFLTGVTATAGLAAITGLTGCAPQASSNSRSTTDGQEATAGNMQTTDPSQAIWPVVEEFKVAGAGNGEIAFEGNPISSDKIIATHEVDVVICGMGHSGSATALACAEAGLNTVAVEKTSTGSYNSATIGGTNSRYHRHWGMAYPEEDFLSDAATESGFQGNLDLYRHWLSGNGEAVDWYIGHFPNQNLDDYPLSFNANGAYPDFREPYEKTALTRSWNTTIALPYTPDELRDMVANYIKDAGGIIRYKCPACQLIADGDRVTGVIVKSEDGYEQYNCAKGVILSTGGYEFNTQMIKERCRPRNVPGSWRSPAMGNTGDGHQMGLAVGAIEDDFPQAIMLDPTQLMSFLRVNALGKRFMPEFEPYSHMALGIQAQPGGFDYYIVDSAIGQKIDYIWTPSTGPSPDYGGKDVWSAAGMGEDALKADTLEELAELMGVPSDDFVDTINHWNAMAMADGDVVFSMPKDHMMTIDTPPYYATRESSLGLCTVGGLIVDEDCHVLNKDHQPIEGLFATGITSGGMYFNTYPHNLNCISHTHNVLMAYTIGHILSA